MKKVSMIWLHPCTLVQFALPKILETTPDSYFSNFKAKIKAASDFVTEELTKIKGVTPIKGQGAMYMLVKIEMSYYKDITDDIDFCKKLLAEKTVLCMPSTCFFEKGYFRIVLCHPQASFEEFTKRLSEFCAEHAA
jgi:tyrosine aminotransferase